jgi:hypothetical protein
LTVKLGEISEKLAPSPPELFADEAPGRTVLFFEAPFFFAFLTTAIFRSFLKLLC